MVTLTEGEAKKQLSFIALRYRTWARINNREHHATVAGVSLETIHHVREGVGKKPSRAEVERTFEVLNLQGVGLKEFVDDLITLVFGPPPTEGAYQVVGEQDVSSP